MKQIVLLFIFAFVNQFVFAQETNEAKELLDQVSEKMGAYENMEISFSTFLVNEEAGISKDDEPPRKGNIILMGEKYNLEYLGNTFLFDGTKLYVINHDDKEITVNEEDLDEEGFIYPSKLITFYKEGYTYEMGVVESMKGKKIQFVELTPIDSESEIVKVRLGINVKDKHIYQLIQIGSNGAETTLTIKNLKSNQEITDATFFFDKTKYEKLDYIID